MGGAGSCGRCARSLPPGEVARVPRRSSRGLQAGLGAVPWLPGLVPSVPGRPDSQLAADSFLEKPGGSLGPSKALPPEAGPGGVGCRCFRRPVPSALHASLSIFQSLNSVLPTPAFSHYSQEDGRWISSAPQGGPGAHRTPGQAQCSLPPGLAPKESKRMPYI